MKESANDFFAGVLAYFVFMFAFEWIFGKLFWDFDSLLVLLWKEKYLCAIILLIVIYSSSYALVSVFTDTNKNVFWGIGLILLLLTGHNVYDLSQAETLKDVGHTVLEMICWADYPEFLQLISVVHVFFNRMK